MVGNLKLHTPEGTADSLAAECSAKKQIENTLAGIFKAYGYDEVKTPTFEYYDVFMQWHDESVLKFFDASGKILALRPDVTMPIARMAATKFTDKMPPLRFCYTANAFRNTEGYQGALQKEFTQSGIELIGVNSADADAEVIAVIINAIKSTGLESFQIDIGHANFFNGLVKQAGLNKDAALVLHKLLDRKDFLGIEEILESAEVTGEIKSIISELPSLFGDIEVLKRAEGFSLCNEAKSALANLQEVYNILCDYGCEQYISVDLGMVQELDYYTGIMFKGFTRGMGFAICGGGRYDSLIGSFGKSMPATGAAIGVDRLLSALYRQGSDFKAPVHDSLICYEEGYRKTAIVIADALRAQGLVIEMYVGGNKPEDYAAAKNIGGIVRILNDNRVELINLEKNERKIVNINELLGKEGE